MKPDAEALIAKYGMGSKAGYACLVLSCGKRDLIEALHTRGVQYQRISEILMAEFKLDIRAGTLGRHCARRCKCP